MILEEAVQKLLKARQDYYQNGHSEFTDAEYDALEEFVRKISPNHPIVAAIGHTPSTLWEKSKHKIPMGSLNKVNTVEEFNKWVNKFQEDEEFVLQLKLDGLSLSLDYEDGLFIKATTRGDGKIGENISPNVKLMKNFKNKFPEKFTGSLRAEILLRKIDFECINSCLEEKDKYSNPRNAAAGISRRLDGLYNQYLVLIYYDISESISEEKKIKKLQSLIGNHTTPSDKGSAKDMVRLFKELKTQRDSLDFNIDGAVIKISSYEIQQSAGILNGRPKGQIAWKFDPPGEITQLLNVSWQTGRTGVITPLGHVTPVEIDGSVVQNVTLHNISEIAKLNIGIGDTIMLVKAGDIIPYCQSVIKRENKGLKIPTHCPSCNSVLENNGVQIFCRSKSCPEKQVQQILHFISTVVIDGLGESLVRRLFELKKVQSIEDLFKLQEEDIANLEGWGSKSAEKILKNINAMRTLPADKLLSAVGIPTLSDKTAEELLKKYGSIENLFTASTEDICGIKGFSTISAESIVTGLKEYRNQIERLLTVMKIKKVVVEEKSEGKLTGMSFCFTGALSQPRSHFQDLVTEAGGKNDSSVTKTTTYLVCNEDAGSSKSQKAAKYGTKIINEEEFLKLLS
jgi:DNA ligase (NAD+)